MENNEIIRVLHFIPNLDAGGTETFIMNMYKNLDRNKIQFDFLVHTNKKGYFDDEIKRLGGRIYHFPIRDDYNIFKYIRDLNKFFKEHQEYKIVHGAMPSIGFIYLFIAKRHHVKVRIAHSHSAFYTKNIKGYIKNFLSKFMKYQSTLNLSCSKKAGEYLFGKKQFEIIHNSIDIKKYFFNLDKRKEIRNKLNITRDKIVLGHVGRLSSEKNHKFMIQLMEKLDREKYIIVFIGGGPLENKLKELVNKKKLEDNIKFLGVCKNVDELIQAFDIFLLPSFFEGLPTVIIEAQAAGLPCIISSSVTKEVVLSKNTQMLPLDKNKWISKITKTNIKVNRNNVSKKLLDLYDITKEANKLSEMYISLNKGEVK